MISGVLRLRILKEATVEQTICYNHKLHILVHLPREVNDFLDQRPFLFGKF